jgi:hypothetical protein
MITKDYLSVSGLTPKELAEILGHQSTSMITKKMDVEMPKRWAKLLDDRDSVPSAVGANPDDSERLAHDRPATGENGEQDWEQLFRENEAPTPPLEHDTVIGPQQIKLSTIDGYIRQIYGGAAYIARNRGDELAADVIERYTPEFSEAWIDYIKSNPQILEYLEKFMIGTPMGNLIGIHVIAIGSYGFARAAANQIAAAHRAESAPSDNGATDSPTDYPMG